MTDNKRWMAWLKRAGALGFVFFFLKGLAWLAVAGVVAFMIRYG